MLHSSCNIVDSKETKTIELIIQVIKLKKIKTISK